MNDQSKLMNPPPSQMMNPPPPIMQQQGQMMNQSQVMNQTQLMNQSQMLMNNRGYNGGWSQQPPPMALDPNKKMKFQNQKPNFSTMKSRSNWNYKKNVGGSGGDKRKDQRRMEQPLPMSMSMPMSMPMSMSMPNAAVSGSGGSTVVGGYKPPTLNELQSQNRLKARKFYPKKKFNNRFAPYAPRNTTSFIIRAKKSGGIASLVSPCPVTPAVLPTPIFSPSREVLGDTAKEEWGVDGYGSMKGLIRLRSPGHDAEVNDEEEEEEGGSSESDVEEHVEVERRLDHDLSRFEMIYPSYGGDYNNVLENRVDDQDSHIAQLEEENLTLKERLFLMERELADLRRRMQFLERRNHVGEYVNEEVVENGSENDSDGGSDIRDTGDGNHEEMEYVSENAEGKIVNADSKVEGNHESSDSEGKNVNVDSKLEGNQGVSDSEGLRDVDMDEIVAGNLVVKEDELKEEVGNKLVAEDVVTENEQAGNNLVAGEDIVAKEKDFKDEESCDTFVAGEDVVAKENDFKNEESGDNLAAGEDMAMKNSNGKDEEVENDFKNEESGNNLAAGEDMAMKNSNGKDEEVGN